jgi:hypothetical protein
LLRRTTGVSLQPNELAALPRQLDWENQLGHQTAHLDPAEECLARVREAWAAAGG